MLLSTHVTTPQSHRPDPNHGSPPASSPSYQHGTAYVLAIAGSITRRHWVEALAGLDVTPTQFKLIMALATAGPLGQRELAEHVGIDPRNCGPVVDALVDRAVLARETDSIDRRRRVLHLTRTGKHLARKLESANAATENALLERLGPSEYASLREQLLPIIRAESADR